MGILKSYINKIEEEQKNQFFSKDLKSLAADGLPKDIRRSPGGNFEKQPDYQYPSITVQPFYSDVSNPDQMSDTVKSLFNVGAKDFAEAVQRLEFISERVSGLEQSLSTQYPNEFDLLPLQVSLQNTIRNISEIKTYFDEGATGKLNLKMSQKGPPQALVTINQYFNDALSVLVELYKNIQVLYNQASNKLDPTQKDVRALLWEATYAFQAIRDSHDLMRKQYSQHFETPQNEIPKPNVPKKKDDLGIEVKPPKEIIIPEYKFETPTSQPQTPKQVINVPPPATIAPQPKTPEEKNPVIQPSVTPTQPVQPSDNSNSPIGEIPDNSTQPNQLSPFDEAQWKSVSTQENKDQFIQIFNTLLDQRLQNVYNKWMVNVKAPNLTTLPMKNKKYLEVEKKDGKLLFYRIITEDHVKKMTEDQRK